MPLSWAFLIVQVIHGEMLAGHRQFWITRPYEWKKLLAAKVLFMVSTINLPVLVADVYVVHKAGFHLSSSIFPGLMLKQLSLVCLMLPIIASPP